MRRARAHDDSLCVHSLPLFLIYNCVHFCPVGRGVTFYHSREGGALANFVFWRSVIHFQIVGAQQLISLVHVSLCVH